MDRVQRFDFASGEISDHRTTSQGGLIVRGNLTRTGVLLYRNADGSVRRELRHPDEVFDADSLESLAHATLTDDHPPGPVNPDSWRSESIGYVAGRPKRNGMFVSSDEIHVQHGPAIDKVKRGKLVEFSCGYECHLDATPGVWEGEPYDGIQRRIRYNHLAAGPPGWGRAGSEVRMRMDGGAAFSNGGETIMSERDREIIKEADRRCAQMRGEPPSEEPDAASERSDEGSDEPAEDARDAMIARRRAGYTQRRTISTKSEKSAPADVQSTAGPDAGEGAQGAYEEMVARRRGASKKGGGR